MRKCYSNGDGHRELKAFWGEGLRLKAKNSVGSCISIQIASKRVQIRRATLRDLPVWRVVSSSFLIGKSYPGKQVRFANLTSVTVSLNDGMTVSGARVLLGKYCILHLQITYSAYIILGKVSLLTRKVRGEILYKVLTAEYISTFEYPYPIKLYSPNFVPSLLKNASPIFSQIWQLTPIGFLQVVTKAKKYLKTQYLKANPTIAILTACILIGGCNIFFLQLAFC